MEESESSTSKIFESAIEEIIRPGGKLELFAPDYTDDLPEAKELGIGFQATTMYYRARSRVPDVWIMFTESSSRTDIPGYPQYSGMLYDEQLSVHSDMPEFVKSPFAPHLSPTLEYGCLYALVALRFDKNRRLKSTEIRHSIGEITDNRGATLLAFKMIELASRAVQEFLK